MNPQATYLTDIPQEIAKYGFCKTLAVRNAVIHWKHIFTEIFVRKTININFYLDQLDCNVLFYIEFMTNRLRKIHHFSREYRANLNRIVKSDRDSFFRTLQLNKGLENLIILDFDGVVTDVKFHELYKLCIERNKTVICSANPTISEEYFTKRNLPIPHKIYSCKGKVAKIKKFIKLSELYDNIFYIDNEPEYLRFAWIFGINTFQWYNNKITYFTLKTK